ncbi:hypothetical protein ACF07T_37355 [Streptomyces sp. NPDC015184]|uniref:hypothetical protein n=1 Tax=Streptomyces sp. NPDC015184 TaxID=3364946 RepID=UPI0036FB77FF
MPTYETTARFTSDLDRLTPEQRRRFRRSVEAFVDGLRTGSFRPSLRVKGVRRAPGVYELTWAGNGRATWMYGVEVRRGEHHIIWQRIGTHDILAGP